LLICPGFTCLAYGEQPPGHSLVAGKDTQQEAHRSMQNERKVVFHLDRDEEDRLTLALENIKNLFKEVSHEQCRVGMVANGKAVKLFHKDAVGKHAADMEELHKLGVRFMACRNAMAKNKMEKSDLFPVCEVVPAGILELIDLQAKGYGYIKP
jgi:uncharacterized protein